MDMATLVIFSSCVLQVVAALLAVRFILLTRRYTAGFIMLATIILMAFRRFISLYRIVSGGTSNADPFAEVVALTISVMTIVGIAYVTRLTLSEKKTLRQLKESEKFLKTLIETQPECFKLLGPDGRLLMMNNAGLEMLEAGSFEQVRGTCVYPMVSPDHRDSFRRLTEKVFQGGTGSMEFEMTGLKGRNLWLETHAVPLQNEHGDVIALLSITRNITDRKQLEHGKEQLIAELKDALANVKILRGFLPICASCKKIRDDKGYWSQIESYIRKHSEAEFSHGICPDCVKKIYPDFV